MKKVYLGNMALKRLGKCSLKLTPRSYPLKSQQRLPLYLHNYKENNVLPDINYSTLSSPDSVVKKYPSLLKSSRIPTLALKLAKEAYFGPEVMKHCTVKGNSGFYALPEEELASLKKYIFKLALPRYVSNRYEFEQLWKECTNSIGQGCKHSR